MKKAKKLESLKGKVFQNTFLELYKTHGGNGEGTSKVQYKCCDGKIQSRQISDVIRNGIMVWTGFSAWSNTNNGCQQCN